MGVIMKPYHRVLIVGAGSIGERHLRCFEATGRCVMAVCERLEARRHEVAKRYNVQYATGNLEDALAFRPTAAVICTPTDLHVSTALQLARSGVHLLIEKPLSTTLAGIDDLCRLVTANRLVASVAYVHRAHPALQQMKQQIESGRFGRPLHVYAMGGSHFPTGRPDFRQIYYSRHKTGGGAIQDALTHIVNAAEWLVGPVTQLSSDADRLALDGIEVEDTVHVMARHGKVMSCFCLNQYQFPSELSITVVCEKATCRYEPEKSRWRWMAQPKGDWVYCSDTMFTERDKLYQRQAALFLDSIDNRTRPLCSLSEAEQSLRINLMLLENTSPLRPINHGLEVQS
jgi:predicted dehydrogenase